MRISPSPAALSVKRPTCHSPSRKTTFIAQPGEEEGGPFGDVRRLRPRAAGGRLGTTSGPFAGARAGDRAAAAGGLELGPGGESPRAGSRDGGPTTGTFGNPPRTVTVKGRVAALALALAIPIAGAILAFVVFGKDDADAGGCRNDDRDTATTGTTGPTGASRQPESRHRAARCLSVLQGRPQRERGTRNVTCSRTTARYSLPRVSFTRTRARCRRRRRPKGRHAVWTNSGAATESRGAARASGLTPARSVASLCSSRRTRPSSTGPNERRGQRATATCRIARTNDSQRRSVKWSGSGKSASASAERDCTL